MVKFHNNYNSAVIMSQWNNTYAYNNRQQDPGTWSTDANRQYSNQVYYSNPSRQYDPSNQYVSFDEFLTQIQPSTSTTNASSYNNAQYQNYPNNQYNATSYQSGPSAQSSQLQFGYEPDTATFSNHLDHSQDNIQSQVNHVTQEQNDYPSNEIVTKSRLTATASEFVPKFALKPSNGSVNNDTEQELPKSNYNAKESTSKHQTPSSSTNWRERPNSSHQSSETHSESNGTAQKNYKSQKFNGNYNKYEDSNKFESGSSYNNRRDVPNRYNDYNSRNNRNKNRSNNENSQNPDSNSRNSDPSHHKSENNLRNKSRNNETSYTNQDSYNSPDYDSQWSEGGQSRNNSKSKNKELDIGRTFYNSAMPKNSQDARNGKGEGSGRGRNWAGSQRLRAAERNSTEDEQFASSYLQYNEEKHRDNKYSPNKSKSKSNIAFGESTELTQRDRLSEQLDKGTLECLVCCERVKQIDPVWYCGNCYHVLHLRCIRKWAMSSMVEGKWRCPACQNTSEDIPVEYRCMCGAVRNPDYQRGSGGAHTCGRSCKRPRNCPHPCTLLCHPGPCPPCQATVSKQCGCGAETRSVLCSSKLPQVCGRQCSRKLECTVHSCVRDCHEGSCDRCEETVTQVCYCPAAKSRTIPCTAESGNVIEWSCGEECGRIASCGAHVCRARCHPPPCPPCPLRPESVPTCPCGNTKIGKDQRKSCTDPIPLCERICAKPLLCGPAGDKHFCKENCHEGACRTCPDNTVLPCRCGHSSREVACAELPQMYDNVLCQRKCNKKMSCGRHRCHTVCCDAQSHPCTLVCGRTLSCQLHRCEDFCHTGHCAPCPQVSFEELRCTCGAEVVLPPVRCGTRAPACSAPCRRARPCGHEPHHSCHQGDCPPCVVLTTKMCYGRHEERKTIPCSQEEFSCGMPCGKPLPCGKHTCIKTCHTGSCDAGKCTQPCKEKRPSCGHECAAPCHSSTGSPCPTATLCRRPVRATCACARRTAERACCDNARDYARMMSILAATKMQEGGSVDISEVQRPVSMLKTLECDEECYVEARSRRMALALQIRNPDVSAKLAPRYSEHVRSTAAREPAFAQLVHDRLADLVQLAKKSKQKTRAHSFPSMNRQKRQFIHEMCEHFGCESVAYDAEPNRNVVATADREKSWLPAMSVMEVLAREAGRRRVPGPVLRAPPQPAPAPSQTLTLSGQGPAAPGPKASGWATLTSSNAWAARSQARPAPKVDYFDNPPEA